MSRGYMSGGKCPGVTCPGGLCPRTATLTILKNISLKTRQSTKSLQHLSGSHIQ